jgi:hypothetical protein
VIAGQGIDLMVHPDYWRGLRRGRLPADGARLLRALRPLADLRLRLRLPNRSVYPIGVRLVGYRPVVKPLPTLYRNFFDGGDDDEGRARVRRRGRA